MLFRPKSAEKDFELNMLPCTRRQVFFDVFKLHFGKLLLCGLILLVFSMPFHIFAIMKDMSELSYYESYNAGTMTAAEAYSAIMQLQNFTALINTACYVVFAIGFAGVARIIKRYAWEENVYIGGDFLKGIKQNTKQYLPLALIVGVVAFGCSYVLNINTVVGLIPTVLCAVILGPIAAYMTVCSAVYSVKFTKVIKYAVILYGKNIFKTLLACIICFTPFVIQLIPNLICHIVGRLLSTLLIPYIMLGWFLFTYNNLDKCLNKDYYPELVNKGLYLPEKKEGNSENTDESKK